MIYLNDVTDGGHAVFLGRTHVKKNLNAVDTLGRLLSTNLPQTIDPVYINRVKQMSDMSYTLEQFKQDKANTFELDC